MSKPNTGLMLLAALYLGACSAFIAHACGVPWWRSGLPSIGDATDIGVTFGSGVYFTLRSVRP